MGNSGVCNCCISFIEDSRHGESDIERFLLSDETLPAGKRPNGWPAFTCLQLFKRADRLIFLSAEFFIGSTGKKQFCRASMRISMALARSLKSSKREPMRADNTMPSKAPNGWLDRTIKARWGSDGGRFFRFDRNSTASGLMSTSNRI